MTSYDKTEQLKFIWNTVFDEDSDVTDFYFDRLFTADNVLYEERDGKPVSALHLLPAEIRYCGGVSRAIYIYAAATLPEYRGLGLMRGLLSRAENEARRREIDLLFLTPAEKSLYAYYGQSGFLPAFSSVRTIVNTSLFSDEDFAENVRIGVPSSEDIFYLLSSVPDTVIWQTAALDFFLMLCDNYGYPLFCAYEGQRPAALLFKDGAGVGNDSYNAVFQPCDRKYIMALLKKTACNMLTLQSPFPLFNLPGSVIFPCGMVKPVADNQRKIISDISGVYSGMSFS